MAGCMLILEQHFAVHQQLAHTAHVPAAHQLTLCLCQNSIGSQQAGGPSHVHFTSQGELITMRPGSAPAGSSMSTGFC